jgi:hypothetical protein
MSVSLGNGNKLKNFLPVGNIWDIGLTIHLVTGFIVPGMIHTTNSIKKSERVVLN